VVHSIKESDLPMAEIESQIKTPSQDDLIEDPLTGVASRRYLVTKGAQDISLARRHKESVAVLQFEIDEFKSVYTEFGDEVADELMKWVALTLKSLCRAEDVVARIRGAVFAVLAPRTDTEQAIQMCKRLRSAVMDRAFVHNAVRLPVTFSVGVAVFGHDDTAEIEDLVAVAAQHTAEAQRAGGNSVVAESGSVIKMEAPREAMPLTGASTEKTDKKSAPAPKLATTGVSLDKALEVLASDQRAELKPYVASLIRRIVPLLEYANKELNLSLGFAIEAMKKRLQEVAIEREFGED